MYNSQQVNESWLNYLESFRIEKGLQSIWLALSLLYAPVVKTQLEKVEFETRQRTKQPRISYGRGSCDVAGLGGGSAFATTCQVSDYTQLRYNGGLSLLPSLPSVAVSAFLPSSSFPLDSFYSSVNTNKIPCFFLFSSFSFVNFLWKACITTSRGMTSWDTLAEWEARRKDINLINYMSIKLYLKSST